MDELPTYEPKDPVYAPPFWLSHHRWDERHKCVELNHTFFCARCLGTYPTLFALLVFQLHKPMAPPALALDPWILYGLAAPAVLDWSLGQLTAWRGSNAVRFVSGVLLGGALGRAVYVNMRHPGSALVYGFLLALCGVAGIVWGLRQVLGSRR